MRLCVCPWGRDEEQSYKAEDRKRSKVELDSDVTLDSAKTSSKLLLKQSSSYCLLRNREPEGRHAENSTRLDDDEIEVVVDLVKVIGGEW